MAKGQSNDDFGKSIAEGFVKGIRKLEPGEWARAMEIFNSLDDAPEYYRNDYESVGQDSLMEIGLDE